MPARRGVARAAGIVALVLVLGAVASCTKERAQDASGYRPRINPADFVPTITNAFLPLKPGARWVYEGGGERIVVEVTADTKTVLGVPCVVVRDSVSVSGRVVEDTFDWFAQDTAGNVWYFGEDSRTMRDGKIVSTEGSWQAGVDGAQPGIVMQAGPRPGERYRQEYYPGKAEDMGRVIRTGDSVSVPYGSFGDVLVIEDSTPLEPGHLEHKFYASGIGLVLEANPSGGGRIELVEFTRPG